MGDISDKFLIEEIGKLKDENVKLENRIKDYKNAFTLSFMAFEKSVIDTKYIIEFTKNGFKVEQYQDTDKYKKAIDIIKKHFIIKLSKEIDYNKNIWGRLVRIKWKEDEDTYDTTACANLANYKEEFELLEEVFK